MIPSVDNALFTELELETRPSKNYKMDVDHNIINGNVVELDAVKQAVFKILNTQRYQYPVYSWDYGIETEDLFGEPADYVCAELERRVRDALTADDRIVSVDGFKFDISEKRVVKASFSVHSIYGSFDDSKAVSF